MARINRKLVINYKHIFGKSNDNFQQDIATLDKQTWFKILARFNFLLRNDQMFSISTVLNMWFRPENRDYANQLFTKIKAAYGADADRDPTIMTLNLWTNLTLLDKILQQK